MNSASQYSPCLQAPIQGFNTRRNSVLVPAPLDVRSRSPTPSPVPAGCRSPPPLLEMLPPFSPSCNGPHTPLPPSEVMDFSSTSDVLTVAEPMPLLENGTHQHSGEYSAYDAPTPKDNSFYNYPSPGITASAPSDISSRSSSVDDDVVYFDTERNNFRYELYTKKAIPSCFSEDDSPAFNSSTTMMVHSSSFCDRASSVCTPTPSLASVNERPSTFHTPDTVLNDTVASVGTPRSHSSAPSPAVNQKLRGAIVCMDPDYAPPNQPVNLAPTEQLFISTISEALRDPENPMRLIRGTTCYRHRVRFCRARAMTYFFPCNIPVGAFVVVESGDKDASLDVGAVINVESMIYPVDEQPAFHLIRIATPEDLRERQLAKAMERELITWLRTANDRVSRTPEIDQMTFHRVCVQAYRQSCHVFYTTTTHVDVPFKGLVSILYRMYQCRFWMNRTGRKGLSHVPWQETPVPQSQKE